MKIGQIPVCDSVNILESLHFLTTDPICLQISVLLDESRIGVKAAIQLLLANLLGVIVCRGSTKKGGGSLLGVLSSSEMFPGLLSTDLNELFSGNKSTQDLMMRGETLLMRLLGRKAGDLCDAIACLSGLRDESVMSLLAMMTPIILTMVKRVANANCAFHHAGIWPLMIAQKEYLFDRVSGRVLMAVGMEEFSVFSDSSENYGIGAVDGIGNFQVGAMKFNKIVSTYGFSSKILRSSWILVMIIALVILVYKKIP
ncbi:hypothetical protein BTM_6106 (plasmid) [Burkholderia thailandensis 34]|uniref:DUF937 domain-containing protein n=1 Tax=Burkholderia thailandensis TaxID=57975 RepID=UPI0007064C2A|nr:DUF937 domain-containing protein [Burkholderia thailandensis]AJY27069.1 hypothetical protein BTM_6106 [Burkholderia thailandensis 34]PNE73150.1 DUF937 domain-containing protein [Burkholderia thailandensis]